MFKRRQEAAWSPYGHERARRALLNQRRAQIALAAIAVAVLYAVFLVLTLEEQTTDPDQGLSVAPPEQKPITVTVRPGEMAEFVDASQGPPDAAESPRVSYRPQNQIVETVQPFLMVLMPLAGAFWLLGRIGTSARGKLAELNLGVFKGAMPYELHTARAYKAVFTHREVDAHVFGKMREDFLFGSYLDAPPISVRRLLGEDIDTAHVATLKRGGARRVAVTPAAAQRSGLGRFVPDVKELRAVLDRLPGRDPRAARLRELRRKARQEDGVR